MTQPSCISPVKFPVSNPSTTLAFIDSQVEDYQSLIRGVKTGVEIVVLDSTQDGIQQITTILQQRPQRPTVHLVAHGSPGCLILGNGQLKLETLEEYETQLKGWSIRSLCLYACEVGKGDKGDKFIKKLHQLTQAFIAASAHPIGNGHWQLEKTTHPVSVEIPFQPEAIAHYTGVLAAGALDTSFDIDGKVTTDFGSSDDQGRSIAVQADGKIIVAGFSNNDFALVRYNTNGLLDTSFGTNGKVTTPVGTSIDHGNSVAVQADGKIVVAGYSNNGSNDDIALVRYNANGTLDTSFDTDGKVNTNFGTSADYGNSLAVQVDGKILVAGASSNDFALVRYNTNGTLDTSFDTDGKVTTDFGTSADYGNSLAVQVDGKILVAGVSSNDFALVRYNTNGSLDTSFGTNGKVTTPVGSSTDDGRDVVVQTDGKILVTGISYNGSNNDFALVRYNANGTLDTSFDTDGKVTTDVGSSIDSGQSVAVQADGKIVVAGASSNGSNYDFALVRYQVPGITITPSDTLTSEAGDTADLNIVLSAQPTADVIVSLSNNNPQEGSLSTSSVSFNSSNWSIPQLVTVTGVDDFIVDGDISYSIITNAAISSDANYNNLDPTDINLTNIDNDIAGININPISGLTTEAGDTANFNLVLTSQPTSDVLVTLNNNNPNEGTISPTNVTFNSSNWSTPQLVTVTGVDDFIADGDISYSIISSVDPSSDSQYLGLTPDTLNLINQDNDIAGISLTPTDTLTTETGETANFNLVLTSQPTSDVLISLTNSDATEGTLSTPSVTFNSSNWSTPQLVTVTGVDDFIVDGDIAYSIISSVNPSSDSKYTPLPSQTLNLINQDNDITGINLTTTDTLTSEAGDTANFNLVLTSQPTSDVLVSLSNNNPNEGTLSTPSVTFNSSNWSTPQLVTVTGVDDNILDGNINYSIITNPAISSDPNYNGLNPNDINLTNIDNDIAGINLTSSDTLTSESGDTANFNLVLTSQPTSDVLISLNNNDTTEGNLSTNTISFTPNNWSSPQLVTVTGVDDNIKDGNINYSITASVQSNSDSQYAQLVDKNITLTNIDDDQANILIDPTTLTVTEGTPSNYSIVLTTEPINPVTISFNTDEELETITDITFNKNNWDSPQTVLVEAVDDQELQGDRNTTIDHEIITSDSNYNELTISSVSVQIQDNDSPSKILINPTQLTLTEGKASVIYQMSLTTEPSSPVIIDFKTDDLLQPISSRTFDQNNWNQPQSIEVQTVDDAIAEPLQTTTINHTLNTTDPKYIQTTIPDLIATINDDDIASVKITQSQGSTEVAEGGVTDSYEVILTSEPTANVTVKITPDSQTDLGNGSDNPIELIFTSDNWNSEQSVTVTAIDDSLVEDKTHTSTLLHSISSNDSNYNSNTPIFIDEVKTPLLTVNITENDQPLPPGIPGIRLIQPVNSTEVWEGFGLDNYKVVLESEPTDNVVITINSNQQVKTNQQTLTFTPGNWNIPQIVWIEGIEDQVQEGEQTSLLINHSAKSSDSRYNGKNKELLFDLEDNDNSEQISNLNDKIIGLTSKDNEIQGSQSDDIIYGRQGNDELMGQGGNDIILGQQDADGLLGEEGNDVLIGGKGNDFLEGGIGDDVLFGGEGNDRLYGQEGNDQLLGDLGNDRLDGGKGTDTLTGFLGNDAFVINGNWGSNDLNQVDRIIDFKLSEDVIELSANLTFKQLNIIQGTGQFSQDVLIQLKSNGQYLAILKNIQAIALESNDFV